MVNETPVLDIKPYIPQYDNPDSTNFIDINTETNVFHHESTSEDQQQPCSSTSLNVRSVRQIENYNVRVMDGEENARTENPIGASANNTQEFNSSLEESYHDSRSASRIGEREAPDGEEEENPRQSTARAPLTLPQRQEVRVPSWIDRPPVSTLTVEFKDSALRQLRELGPEEMKKKTLITNVLREDPRSIYLREQVESSGYVFRIAELYVSCRFDDNSHTVTVYQIYLSTST